MAHQGPSAEIIAQAQVYTPATPHYQMILQKAPIYVPQENIPNIFREADFIREKPHTMAVLPIIVNYEVIG